VIIGHEKTGLRPADEENYCSRFSTALHLGQFFHMLLPPSGDRIRKHGHSFAKESAGFDLQIDLFFSPLQEKVKPAVSVPGLPFENRCPLQAGDHSISEEVFHQVIRPVSVGHDRPPFSFNGHDRVGQFSFRLGGFFEVKDSPRQQKLPKASRVGKKGLYGFPVEVT
jgi:hypothetical protein